MPDSVRIGEIVPQRPAESPKPASPAETVQVERHCGRCGNLFTTAERADLAPTVPLERRRLGLCLNCQPRQRSAPRDYTLRPMPRTGGYDD